MTDSVILYRYFLPIFSIGWAIILFREVRRIRNTHFTAIALIAFLYPLGKFFQFWLIGPTWIRWYMSDVGFVSCLALTIAYSPFRFFGRTMLERIRRGIGSAFRLAVLVETLQLIAKPYITDRPKFSASGDWMDMAIFFVMYGVNRYLLAKLEKQCRLPATQHQRQRKKRAVVH